MLSRYDDFINREGYQIVALLEGENRCVVREDNYYRTLWRATKSKETRCLFVSGVQNNGNLFDKLRPVYYYLIVQDFLKKQVTF